MKKIIIVLALPLVLFSCGQFSNSEKDSTRDMRIVCVSKQLNEMIFALGKGHDIVAVDLSSTYPDSAKLLPTVGYHRMLSAEGIISMKPDIVLHDNDMGPASVLPQLEKSGLNIKAFEIGRTIDSSKIILKQLADFFHVPQIADSLNKKLDADLLTAKNTLAAINIKDTPTVMVIQFGRANNSFFVMSGRGGITDRMIELAGGKPAHYDAKGARQMSAEAVATANPDIIIATDYGFDKMGGAENFKNGIPGLNLTNAAKNNRIYRFEEHDLVYFGPRTGGNVMRLMKLFYPNANVPAK
ncbi:MAG: ABC transporter substrate-binding protein [Bacteroidota bacterium]|nr:ABC transporter substrate-binding protein [Bacteroidota bacterium]